jgi:hypothetical protein
MKPAPPDQAKRRRCTRCNELIQWARTEAKGLSIPIEPDEHGDLMPTGNRVDTPRGNVLVVRYVRNGDGTFRQHSHQQRPERDHGPIAVNVNPPAALVPDHIIITGPPTSAADILLGQPDGG